MIVTDEKLLRIASEPVRDVREGGVVARKLSAALERLNKKAEKKYVKNLNRKAERPTLTKGIGLAAPQIGIHKRVVVIKTGPVPIVLMNPVVVDASSAKVPYKEGCLSIPGVEVETWRHIWLKVSCLNHPEILTFGRSNELRPDINDLLLTSVAVQHELDHLDGVLMVDRIEKETAAA